MKAAVRVVSDVGSIVDIVSHVSIIDWTGMHVNLVVGKERASDVLDRLRTSSTGRGILKREVAPTDKAGATVENKRRMSERRTLSWTATVSMR